ncbi:YhcN/YlaJ family sporulation lipoprotein [Bacillus sp. Bva_UNVM-123]|uniref:YhcN/YlaJ family sporulation lipoprotein n=1 Tax=Bacillus sp. Bva_UNVM-123 TaxID=2829798 RepID=UPI00391F6204
MRSKTFLSIGLAAVLLSACGVNNDGNGVKNTAYRNRDMNEPTRVNYPGNYNNAGYYNGAGNRYNGIRDVNNDTINGRMNDGVRNTNIGNNLSNNTHNATSRMRVADRAADKIASMPEVDSANVIVTDNNAYVGARLANGKNLSRNLERKIADQVKSADRDINDVYISVNPDFYDRVTNYSNDIRNGKPIEGFFDEFTNTIKRVFPTHINK